MRTYGDAELGLGVPKSGFFSSSSSREEALYDMAVHVGEPEIAALKPVGELFVIESEQVEHAVGEQ